MTESIQGIFAKVGADDLNQGQATFTQEDRMGTDGVTADKTGVNQINSSNVPLLSSAIMTTLGLSGTKYLDDALGALASGTGIAKANLAVYGLIRTSISTATPQALDVSDPVYGYIPSSVQKSGLGVITSQSVQLTHTPSSTNGYATVNYARDNDPQYGSGKDGAFAVGALTDPASAPTLANSASGGTVAADTYSVKVTFGNATGETLPSSASNTTTTTGATSVLTLTSIPTGGAGTAWRKVYLDEGSGTWKLAAYIPDNTTTTWTITTSTVGQAAPGSNTTGASWSSNVSGEWHFEGDTTLPALTLTGDLVLRVRGHVTISGAIVGTGAGNATNPLKPCYPKKNAANYLYDIIGPGGFGTNLYAIQVPTGGSDGLTIGATAGTGSAPGAMLWIYAYSVTISANVTSNGAAGGAASGTNGSGGGGGGAGIFACICRDFVKAGTVTITLNGGNGGNGAGSGGASRANGGQPGGGGLFLAIAPLVDVGSATITRNAGTIGTDNTSSTQILPGGQGGSCAGDGGAWVWEAAATTASTLRTASAGQSVTASASTGYRFGGLF
jgi:hypothetical protein